MSVLSEGERAAFRGGPEDAIQALSESVDGAPAAAVGYSDWAEAVWLLGVCQGAVGRYGTASRTLDPLTRPAEDTESARHWAGMAATTISSIQRQLSRHEQAREFDQWARSIAPDDPEVQLEAAVGLSADAVGLNGLDEARRELRVARELLVSHPSWWRNRIRADWVQTEISLLSGDPASAWDAASGALTLAEESSAPRHVAKSLLFRGVTEAQAGLPIALETLLRSALLAESLGAEPLVWPARLMLWHQHREVEPQVAELCRKRAAKAIDSISADLPDDWRSQWRARPEVSAVLG